MPHAAAHAPTARAEAIRREVARVGRELRQLRHGAHAVREELKSFREDGAHRNIFVRSATGASAPH